ncbi:MAG: hypothetical protein WAM82_29430 [Thermoanaerobaculia bacterium]
MITRSFRRKTIYLLLVAIFATPWVCAAAPRAPEGPAPVRALEPARVDLLNQIWTTLRSLWSKEGCGIDPNGRCSTSPALQPPPTIQTDTGCGIDPDGRCHS